MKMRFRSLLPYLLTSLLLFGCASRVKNVTNLPPGVTQAEVQAWDSEVAALHKVASITTSVRQGVIALENAGVFPDTVAYVNTLRAIANIDQLEQNASNYLRQNQKTFGLPQQAHVRAMLNAIAGEVKSMNDTGLAGIKNADKRKDVDALITELTAAMNLALSFASN